MATLTPILTATPGNPLTYNVGMAETFSWIPVENDADRPIYARATYLTNASDISVSLSAGNINVSLDGVEASLDNIETLLSDLTAVDYATSAKQDISNSLLAALTGINDSQQGTTNDLLNSLTAIQVDKQDKVITLLHQLTANTDSVESLIGVLTAVNFATASNQQQSNTLLGSLTSSSQQISNNSSSSVSLLNQLTASNVQVAGFSIPPYDEINFEYVGSTDIFRKVVYSNNSTQVLALSFVYVTEPPTIGNAVILKVKKL